ncbi:MAG: NTP transferase domain-containing protein [Rhodospirillales bacterium]|nr:NTP transferase domain-containing protein [Rhodospirillales bacterium]
MTFVVHAPEPFACLPETTVREAMARINDTPPHAGLVVVDGDGRLLGTVTDGDIRRGILRGVALDDAIATCMNAGAVPGRDGDAAGNLAVLAARPLQFLPIIDGHRRLVRILFKRPGGSTLGAALVMAGGAGRRLGERTRATPKPLLPIGDRPILDHVMTALEDAGITDIHVAVHYLADQIESFLAKRQSRADVRVIHEPEPLGTAGAVGLLPPPKPGSRPGPGPLLVVNGDVLTRVDYRALAAFHDRHEFEATVAVARYDVEIPFGVVRQSADGVLLDIDEKPRVTHFVAAGIYVLSPAFRALVPPSEPLDMPDLLALGRRVGLRAGLFPIHEYWTDIGRPHDLEAADTAHRNGRFGAAEA